MQTRKRKKLGELLMDAGLIDRETLDKAVEIQKIHKIALGRVLIGMGEVDDVTMAKALSAQLKLPFVRITDKSIPKEITSLVPPDMANNYQLIPLRIENKRLIVAMANPLEQYAFDDLRFVTQMPLDIVIAPEGDMSSAIARHYPKGDIEKEFGFEDSFRESVEIIRKPEKEDKDIEDILDLAERPPVVRFTNAVLADALKLNASDIHIEPQKAELVIRYRMDGIMREIMKTDRHIHAPFVSRIKVLSNMDISIKRKPQDGKAQIRYNLKVYDLRVSTIPTSYGETVTIRILNPDMGNFKIDRLGLLEKDVEKFTNAIGRPQGIILVTGPTGSGKSSTLYACLNRLNSRTVNIITVEDPVEYDIEGINQVQINPRAGITFAAGLRSILRQDPDIVMVGEIRDSETASIAFQAAQTGHLVLSTLHTNDAPSAVIRLFDLGVEPYMCASSLNAILGQRLVRRVCENCMAMDVPSPQTMRRLPPEFSGDYTFYKGAGCEECQYSGYRGRLAIFELLAITPSLKEIILPDVSTIALQKVAEKEGFTTLFYDGLNKARQGLTTIDEVFRVAAPEDKEIPAKPTEKATDSGREEDVRRAVSKASPDGEVTVLVADDSEDMLKLIQHKLEPEGYLIITAKNGLEALKLAVRVRPDLIITDYIMPVMDGITLIRKLKSQIETRFIPIMMLTAKNDVDSEIEVIDAGADDYLTKPVNSKRLTARVNRILTKNGIGKKG